MEGSAAELLALSRKEREYWNENEEKKLELRLGPPGEENWSMEDRMKGHREIDRESLLSLGSLSPVHKNNSSWAKTPQQQAKLSPPSSSFLQFSSTAAPHSLPAVASEASQHCGTKVLDFQNPENKAPARPAAPSSAQKRTAAPVVGWPPVRSSRRNLASGSASKQAADSPNGVLLLQKAGIEKTAAEPASGNRKGLFVKINMDGVPIGRKVDLKACDSYGKLSAAVDELFRGLLTAQADSSESGTASKVGRVKEITGVLDGNGEYTLVYEDNEGDRMLVGDVPWHMFVSTVKRLRVLKSSDVSVLSLTLASGKKQQDIGLA